MTVQRPPRTLGPGHDTFWEWCAKDELHLPACRACGELAWPIISRCDHCGEGEFDWLALSGKGTLISACSFHKDYYRAILPLPWETILVELEEGPLFVSNPHGFAASNVPTGTALCVVFIDCEDAAGRFRLPVFARA